MIFPLPAKAADNDSIHNTGGNKGKIDSYPVHFFVKDEGGIMSRLDAVDQYNRAQNWGKKYNYACKSRGMDPCLSALEEIVKISDLRSVPVGIIEIPMERIAGTYSESRKNVFAGNFMPLPDDHSEFAKKWIDLCEYHLDGSGIADPVSCYEYLGKFYVREGNKRVSVLKSYDATEISGNVTRLLPPPSEDPEILLYYEFLDFYKVSRLYNVTFSRSGQYADLQNALNYESEQEWTEEFRWEFYNVFMRFSTVFERLNREKLEITAGDALLLYLDVHPYQELRNQTKEEIQTHLNKLWPDLRLFAKGEPVALSTRFEEKGKSIRTLILGAPKIHVVFLYDMEPGESSWVFSHDTGRKYLTRQMENEIRTETLVCDENGAELVEKAIAQGANVVFATSHKHTGICRRIAADHPNIAVFNCTPNTPYAGVRGYYCRTYEGKFIAGAVAGVVAGSIAHQDHIGFVSNYPIIGDTAIINAFALGAMLTNPRAKIVLTWSCVPGNAVKELEEQGIRVISNPEPDNFDTGINWGAVTYRASQEAQPRALVSTRCDWGIYYEKTIRTLLNSGIDSLRDNNKAVNDWWGLRSGTMNIVLSELLPEGLQQLALYLKRGIISRDIHPFRRLIRDQEGRIVCDGVNVPPLEELLRLDWLCDNVEGSIPTYEDLLPEARELVRLFGISR